MVPPTLNESDVPGPGAEFSELHSSILVGESFLITPPGEFATDVLAEPAEQPPEEPLTCVDALFPVIVEVLLLCIYRI
jgi:hypothetical protein